MKISDRVHRGRKLAGATVVDQMLDLADSEVPEIAGVEADVNAAEAADRRLERWVGHLLRGVDDFQPRPPRRRHSRGPPSGKASW